MKTVLLSLVATVLLFLAFTMESAGIPAFSRKYKTSCATCHVAFPKLNAFGEAFRRNGYQFPNAGDEAATKEEPVSMGSEGNKRAFPDAIWPNSIPGTSPLSIITELEVTYTPKETPKWNFSPLEGEMELVGAGTLGEDISFLGELEIADDAIEIERATLIFGNFFGGSTAAANIKIGKFEPGVYSFSNHRRISPKYGMTTATLGDNNWSLESAQKGVELNGVIGGGRLGYNLGLVEGRKNLSNSQKDFYGHVNYKIGGMRLDGVVPEDNSSAADASQPWQDNSVTIGGFIYKGTATLSPSADKDEFTMVGGDVNVWLDRLNLIAAVGMQSDKKPMLSDPTVESSMTSMMVEASYIVYPWLVPLVRFENSKIKDAETSSTRIISAIQFYVRANVRCALEFNFESEPLTNDPGKTDLSFSEFAFGLMFGL